MAKFDNFQSCAFNKNCNAPKSVVWHSIGKEFDGEMTAAQALEAAKADFEVAGREVFVMDEKLIDLLNNGGTINVEDLKAMLINIEDKRANVRVDNNVPLGIVSASYGQVQNKHAFDFVDVLTSGTLGGETPTIESAGVIGKGERIFITAKFPEPVVINGDDVIDMYAMFTTSHDGSGAVSVSIMPIRRASNAVLSCNLDNTRNGKGRISFKHTSHVLERMDLSDKFNAKMAYDSLNVYDLYKKNFETSLRKLNEMFLDDKKIEQLLVKSLLPKDAQEYYRANGDSLDCAEISTRSKNIIAEVTEACHNGIGQDSLTPNSGLWVINGISTYYQNEKNWTDDTKKFDAIVDGSVQTKVQTAIDTLLA